MAYKQCITDVSPIRVTAGYPAYPDGSYHRGIDTVHGDHNVFAPESGTVVVAQVWDGVTTTGDMSWGNMIKVQMADGTTWRAAHFTSQLWHVGDTIAKGQYIGTQGKTGNATGIHTHWEYQSASGALMDPSTILGIPNAVGSYEVEWDASVDPGPGPDPDPDPDPWPTGKIPVWLMFKMAKRGRLL